MKTSSVRPVVTAAILPAGLASAALNFWRSGRYDTFTIAKILGCSEAAICSIVEHDRERKRT